MNKIKLFIDNFLIYGLGGIISKIIPFIMVPIVTRLMPDSHYYGISDMSQTVVSFASALAIMGLYDAMYRMFFEKTDDIYKKEVCSTTGIFTLISSLIVFSLMIILRNHISTFFFEDQKLGYIVYFTALATLVSATNTIVSAPTRMQNKRKVFLVTNTIGPLLSYGIAIPLLLQGYYLIALPLAICISGAIIEISFGIMNREWFHPQYFNKGLLKDLLKIGFPLLPNFLVYWIFNSSDRVMITRLIGISESGVYAVGAKLGMASQLIYTAFAGGWQFFAFSTMKEEKQTENNSKIFEYLGVISFIVTLFVCSVSVPIFKLLFAEEYHRAFIVAPYLFLAPLLQMLFQVACNQFIVIKKTWPNIFILSIGAVVNVILNLILIPLIGIEGASIGTLVGYSVSVLLCVVVLIRMKLMIISKKFFVVISIFCFSFIVWRLFLIEKTWLSLICACFLSIFILLLYKEDVLKILKSIKSIKTKKT